MPRFSPGRRCLLVATALLLASATPGVFAQAYPTRPIRIIVPFAPAGPTDQLARVLAKQMSESLGMSVIVDNRAGASGTIGTSVVAHAEPDGYTLLFHELTAPFAIQPVITKSLPYDAKTDFTPIGLAAAGPIFLLVNSEVPANTLPEFMKWAKDPASRASFASSGGVGQFPTFISPELLIYKYGLTLNHVPYRGAAPATLDVAAGRVSMIMTTGLGTIQPFLTSGKMKALALTGDKRAAALPNVKTFAEQGYPLPEVANGTQWGLFGPAKLPRDIVVKLNAAVVKAMTSAEAKTQLAQLNIDPKTSTPEELSAMLKKESDTWVPIMKAMKIEVEQ